MAGNIIPAIATTNAITAGLVVMRAFNVLLEQYELCQSVYVRLRLNPRNQIFVPDRGMYSLSQLFLVFFYQFTRNFCLQKKIIKYFTVVHRIDGTKSKMYRLLGKATSCGENRYEACNGETIP